MKQYLDLMQHILDTGTIRKDRTGVGTIGVFGGQMRFDLSEGFPLMTTKKMFLRGIIEELLWFLKGESNICYLLEKNVHIWDEWATPSGEIGPLYPTAWRNWSGKPTASYHTGLTREHHDQITNLIQGLKDKPFSRRHVVSAWNVENLPDESISPQENVKKGKMALAPCHCLFQFYVEESEDKKRRLSCQLYQRSMDGALGASFNIASYALLTMMVAQCVDMEPGEFIHTVGDAHVYLNHVETLSNVQLKREPKRLPRMQINPEKKDIFSFSIEDFTLVDYECHPALSYPIAI